MAEFVITIDGVDNPDPCIGRRTVGDVNSAIHIALQPMREGRRLVAATVDGAVISSNHIMSRANQLLRDGGRVLVATFSQGI